MNPQNPLDVNDPLEPLLDQALGLETLPGGIPTGLEDRVFKITEQQLQARHYGVLARIGRYRWSRAVAAAVIVGACLSISALGAQIVNDARNLVSVQEGLRSSFLALDRYGANPGATAVLSGDDSSIAKADFTSTTSDIDQAINSLDAQLKSFEQSPSEKSNSRTF